VAKAKRPRRPQQQDLFGGRGQVGRPEAGVPCRGCGRRILWRKTNTGKWMPVEVDRFEGWLVPEGAGPLVVVLTPSGALARGHLLDNADRDQDAVPQRASGWLPHWAACPASDTLRRSPRAQQGTWLSERPEPPDAA